MAPRKETIVSYSLEELAAMEARGECKTDWERAGRMPVPDGSDPDDMIENVDQAHVTTTLPPFRRRSAA